MATKQYITHNKYLSPELKSCFLYNLNTALTMSKVTLQQMS
jgi:hypothetical protein